MMTSTKVKRNALYILVFTLIVILVVVLLTIQSVTTISQNISTPQSFTKSAPFGKNSIVLANNRALVAYNYINGTSGALTPDNLNDSGLQAVNSITASSDQKYVAFSEFTVEKKSELDKVLDSYGYQDSGLGYWFIYDVAAKKLEPLPTDTLLLKIFNDRVYTLAYANGSQYIVSYSLAGGLKQLSSMKVSGVSDFYPVSGGYLLQSPNNSISFTNNGKVFQTVFKSAILDGVSRDGQKAIGTVSSNKLTIFNLNNFSKKVVSSDVVNQPVWSTTLNEALYFTGDPNQPSNTWKLNTYNLNTNKHALWQFKNSGNFANLNLVYLLNPDVAMVSKSKVDFRLIGSGLKNIKLPTSSYFQYMKFGSSSLSLNYSGQQNAVLIYSPSQNPTIQAAAYQQLRKSGFDPNLLNIKYTD